MDKELCHTNQVEHWITPCNITFSRIQDIRTYFKQEACPNAQVKQETDSTQNWKSYIRTGQSTESHNVPKCCSVSDFGGRHPPPNMDRRCHWNQRLFEKGETPPHANKKHANYQGHIISIYSLIKTHVSFVGQYRASNNQARRRTRSRCRLVEWRCGLTSAWSTSTTSKKRIPNWNRTFPLCTRVSWYPSYHLLPTAGLSSIP